MWEFNIIYKNLDKANSQKDIIWSSDKVLSSIQNIRVDHQHGSTGIQNCVLVDIAAL